jgi:hypothetical protein
MRSIVLPTRVRGATWRTPLRVRRCLDLANDIADATGETGSAHLQHLVSTLELPGVGISLMLDQDELADPHSKHPLKAAGASPRDRAA